MEKHPVKDVLTQLCQDQLGRKAGSKRQNYFLIPGNGGFRWILPENPAAGLPFIKQWRPYGLRSRLKWRFLIRAYQSRFLTLLPGVKKISTDLQPLFPYLKFLKNTFSGHSPVVYIGTPGIYQKAVAGIVNNSSMTVECVLKLPMGPLAREKTAHEVTFINKLRESYQERLPEILYWDRVKGISAQSHINGSLSGRKLSPAHFKWLETLKNGKSTTLSEHYEDLIKKLAFISDNQLRSLRNLLRKRMTGKIMNQEIFSVWTHGDFAPWNIKRSSDGLCCIDWEEGGEDGLPLQDCFYFLYIQAFLFGKKKNQILPRQFKAKIEQHAGKFKISPAMIPILHLYFLVNLWKNKYDTMDENHQNFLFDAIKMWQA